MGYTYRAMARCSGIEARCVRRAAGVRRDVAVARRRAGGRARAAARAGAARRPATQVTPPRMLALPCVACSGRPAPRAPPRRAPAPAQPRDTPARCPAPRRRLRDAVARIRTVSTPPPPTHTHIPVWPPTKILIIQTS